jgi:hypothetical protein
MVYASGEMRMQRRCGCAPWWRRLTARIFHRAPQLFDYGDWQQPEPPPDIGVREPRRPRPSAGGASAVIDPPS